MLVQYRCPNEDEHLVTAYINIWSGMKHYFKQIESITIIICPWPYIYMCTCTTNFVILHFTKDTNTQSDIFYVMNSENISVSNTSMTDLKQIQTF